MLIGIGEMTKFEAEEEKDIEQEVKLNGLDVTAGRLMIPSHVGVEFAIIQAVVKHKDVERASPIVFGGGSVSAVVFSETSFGLHALHIKLGEGDLIQLKVKSLTKAPRYFTAALDCWVQMPAGAPLGSR
jgi:hypothetical protein